MAYEVVMSYHLHMPSYFLGTFTEYPSLIHAALFIRAIRVIPCLKGLFNGRNCLYLYCAQSTFFISPLFASSACIARAARME